MPKTAISNRAATRAKINGVIIHTDDKRVAIAVFNSDNRKTGNMIQVYILNRNEHPVEAVQNGTDDIICGNCPLRSGNGCYVRVEHGPSVVYKAYKAGKYPVYDQIGHSKYFRGRSIRWGAYGDPVYIPFSVISYFNSLAENWTGYTHRWRDCDSVYASVFMASCEDKFSDTINAHRLGYRTFTISDHREPDEIYCPASLEGGNKTFCISCGLCNGSRGDNDPRKNIVIKPHGKNKNKLIQLGV